MSKQFHDVHVFGQWNKNPADRRGNPWFDRWCTVKGRAPHRMPLIGYYDPSKQADMDLVIMEMKRGRIDDACVCAYFNGEKQMFEETYFIDGLKASEIEGKPGFYLSLELRGSFQPLRNIFDLGWMAARMREQFAHPLYKHIDGKPAVNLVHMEWVVETLLPTIGLSLEAFLDKLKDLCAMDIYWMMSTESNPHWVAQAAIAKANAITAYNWVRWQLDRDGVNPTVGPVAKDPADLMALYSDAWAWLVRKSKIEVILPTIGGFDDINDNGLRIGLLSTKQLRQHLGQADAVADANPTKVRGTIHCALDEFFEGPRMIPDAEFGFATMAAHADAYAEVQP